MAMPRMNVAKTVKAAKKTFHTKTLVRPSRKVALVKALV